MGLFSSRRRRPSKQPRHPEWDGEAFDLDDPRIPPAILRDVLSMYSEDDTLFYADTDEGGEWWLIDSDDNLVEAFWLE